MDFSRVIAAVLTACALPVARGADGFAVGGRLVPDGGGAPLASGTYRLEAAFATNATVAAFAFATVTVKTDAAGDYVATLPVSVDALADAGASVWLRQTFRTADGASVVATPPAQRLGSAPYALQAAAASRLASSDGAHAVSSLGVSNALVSSALVVTNRLLAGGVLLAQSLATDAAPGATVRIDRLAVGSAGSKVFARTARDTRVGPDGGTLALTLDVASDGLFELALLAEGASGLTATLRRTGRNGVTETLCALDAPEAEGTTRRVLTAPVRSGDTLVATAGCGDTGRVTATCDFMYFGTNSGGSTPGGENE